MAKERHLLVRILMWTLAFLALVACNETGGWIVRSTGLPFPGTVIGILILLTILLCLRHVPQPLRTVSLRLLQHLNLFYVPAGVGVLGYVTLIAHDLWPIIVTMFVSTFLATIAAGLVFQWVARIGDAPTEADE